MAVHRPLAEQLVALANVHGGEHVLEVSAGDGELTRRLRERDATLTITVLDWSQRQRPTQSQSQSPSPSPPRPPQPSQSQLLLPYAPATFDIALSLLALEPGAALTTALAELVRVAHRARILIWEDGATHDNALSAAWSDAGGGAPSPVSAPAATPARAPGWSRSVLTDVARFDSSAQFWAALVVERGIDVPPDREQALRERLADHVAPFTAADGTLRVPVRATLLALR